MFAMDRSVSNSSVRSTSRNSDKASGAAVPSYMRTTTASQNKTSCTPRSKSQEDFRRTPSVKATNGNQRERKASTPVSKSESQPNCNISGISSIGSMSKQTTATTRPGVLRMGAFPTEGPSKVRRNIMATAGMEAKCPTKCLPLRVPHKPVSTSFDEDMAVELRKAVVLQAMFLRNQAKKALETVETKAYLDRSFLSRCTLQLNEDIDKLKEEKKELDTLVKLAPCMKMASESFDHLNSSLEAILKVLVSIDDDMNRRCSLVVLKGAPEVLNESTKEAIQELLSNPVMGKRTTIKTQGLELMCSKAVEMSKLVSFIENLVKECNKLSDETKKKMEYASNFRKAILRHGEKNAPGL